MDDRTPHTDLLQRTAPVEEPLPRAATRRLVAAAGVMPVAVVMGARQTGKSTLVRSPPAFADYPYLTLDSSDIRAQARSAPRALLRRAPRLVLDEIQRDPELVLALKEVVDGESGRTPGQFVLTGSANLLEMGRVRDSLAGRAAYTTLWPLSRRERLGLGSAGAWSAFFTDAPPRWPESLEGASGAPGDWRDAVAIGGYPVPALRLGSPEARAIWFQGYTETYLDRDLRDLASIGNPLDMRRLMRVAVNRVGQLVNRAEWARDAGISPTTAFRYLDLLEQSYQLVRLNAFAVNGTKRLIRSPKAYWSDTALALHLAGWPPLTGFHFENLVLTDLLVWRDALPQPPAVMHWRSVTQEEVDFVVEHPDGRLLAVECKAGSRPAYDDSRGVRAFLGQYASAVGGVVVHGGTDTYWLSDRVLAAPWWRIC